MRRAHTTPAPTLATADSSAACSSATCPSRQAVSASSVATANSRCLPSSWESAGRHCETAAGSRQQASEWADGGCELGATDQTQGPADSQMMACAQVWAGSLASWVQCSAVQCSAVQCGAGRRTVQLPLLAAGTRQRHLQLLLQIGHLLPQPAPLGLCCFRCLCPGSCPDVLPFTSKNLQGGQRRGRACW